MTAKTIAKTKDGKEFSSDGEKERLIGSAPTVRSRDVSKPAKVGEFPVCVERFGSYKMFTYNQKIISIDE